MPKLCPKQKINDNPHMIGKYHCVYGSYAKNRGCTSRDWKLCVYNPECNIHRSKIGLCTFDRKIDLDGIDKTA